MELLQSELTELRSKQVKTAKESEKYKEERDAVYSEYKLIMSERDQVISELDKLQTEVELAESKLKSSTSEKKAASEEMEALRQVSGGFSRGVATGFSRAGWEGLNGRAFSSQAGLRYHAGLSLQSSGLVFDISLGVRREVGQCVWPLSWMQEDIRGHAQGCKVPGYKAILCLSL